MSTAEERRQRILANSESRLAKLRDINRYDKPSDIPPMARVSSPAPKTLLQKPINESGSSPPTTSTSASNPLTISSIFSSITSATSMINSFTATSQSKPTPEVTREMLIVDQQHILVAILGIFVGLLYAFYISSSSNFFFLVYFTASICILTSRYYINQMKHRTNVLITTAMLSGFQPELMKQFILVYTLLCDAWIIFAFYFVSFCFTHVICSLFSSSIKR